MQQIQLLKLIGGSLALLLGIVILWQNITKSRKVKWHFEQINIRLYTASLIFIALGLTLIYGLIFNK